MLRARQQSQALVEFGIIAILFVMILFAIIDFGLLLNTWLNVSSGSREIARSAALGANWNDLQTQAKDIGLPSLNRSGFPGGDCCLPSSALEVKIDVYSCMPDSVSCPTPVCTIPGCPGGAGARPRPDDILVTKVIAHGAEVITPLVRPFFACSGFDAIGPVPLTSTTVTRYEGPRP